MIGIPGALRIIQEVRTETKGNIGSFERRWMEKGRLGWWEWDGSVHAEKSFVESEIMDGVTLR